MDEGLLFGRGISFPPRIGPDGRLAWSAGAANIREAIRVILLTEGQERVMLPGFGGGLRSFLFQPNTVTTHTLIQDHIRHALGRWEPRIAVDAVTVEPDPVDEQTAIATIEYTLVATQTRERISLTVSLTV